MVVSLRGAAKRRHGCLAANRVVLLLGGNEGDVAAAFEAARTALSTRVGRIIKASSLHRTAPWGEFEGGSDGSGGSGVPDFLNQVLVVETALEPLALLDATQAIERELGRVRDEEAIAKMRHSEPAFRRSPLQSSVIARSEATKQSSARNTVLDMLDCFAPVGARNDAASQREALYRSRPIDIDILFYGNEVIASERLTIPHPLIARREFVLRPLAEVAPLLKHPLTGLTAEEMILECEE